jgi:sulfite reductase alpha subunit-like flavoprotein
VGDLVKFDVAPGTFRVPQHHVPLICISPGTGVAPMRSILRERMSQTSPGECWLFFGCRSKSKDFYYEDEWAELSKNDKFHIVPAFSRDQNEKVYVQHKLLEYGHDIWRVLSSLGGFVLLSG